MILHKDVDLVPFLYVTYGTNIILHKSIPETNEFCQSWFLLHFPAKTASKASLVPITDEFSLTENG